MTTTSFNIKKIVDREDIAKVLPRILELIEISYHGQYYGKTDPKLLVKSTSLVQAVFKDDVIVACALCRRFQESHKISAICCDQTDLGKKALEAIIKENIINFKDWVWCETSKVVEHYYKKHHGYPIPNCYVATLLRKPAETISLSVDGFHYKRKIGDQTEESEKVIFGFPNQATMDKVLAEVGYEEKRELFNLSKTIFESSKYPEELEQASSFIIQLSDLYDENTLTELVPSLCADFDTAIQTMERYSSEYKWVADELDYAKELRATIPEITTGKF